MTTKKTATLGAGIIATKGAAAPSAGKKSKPAIKDSGERKATTAVTVKLSNAPDGLYTRLKTYGAVNGKTNQDLIEEALSEYLDKLDV